VTYVHRWTTTSGLASVGLDVVRLVFLSAYRHAQSAVLFQSLWQLPNIERQAFHIWWSQLASLVDLMPHRFICLFPFPFLLSGSSISVLINIASRLCSPNHTYIPKNDRNLSGVIIYHASLRASSFSVSGTELSTAGRGCACMRAC
jgi:aryl carrier-like protein